jgi:hypothetical protein
MDDQQSGDALLGCHILAKHSFTTSVSDVE